MTGQRHSSPNRSQHEHSWLKQELDICTKLMPGLNLHVMFADELPKTDTLLQLQEKALMQGFRLHASEHTELTHIMSQRHEALEASLSQHFGDRAMARKFAGECADHDSRLIYSLSVSNAQCQSQPLKNNCGELARSVVITPPTCAFILLPPKFFDSTRALAFRTNMLVAESQHHSAHALHLPEFRHERTHLEVLCAGQPTTPWSDERNADMAAVNSLQDALRPDMATRYQLMRATENFLGPVTQSATAYWNILSQQGVVPFTAAGILRDKSATLELKRRAARQLKNVTPKADPKCSALKLLTSALTAPGQAGLRLLFGAMDENTLHERKVLMHALDRVVENDTYTHPETRYLAHFTYHALHGLFPAIMAEKGKYQPYLHERAPAP